MGADFDGPKLNGGSVDGQPKSGVGSLHPANVFAGILKGANDSEMSGSIETTKTKHQPRP